MGEAAALGAAAAWAVATVLFARVGMRHSALVVNLVKCTIGLVVLWIAMFAANRSPVPAAMSARDLAWVVASAVVGLAISDTAYFRAMALIGARRALTFGVLVPAATAMVAWLLLGEGFTWRMWAGIALSMAGILLVARGAGSVSEAGTAGQSWALGEKGAQEGGAESPSARRKRRQARSGVAYVMVAVVSQAFVNVIAKFPDQGIPALDLSVVRLGVGTSCLAIAAALTGELRGVAAPLREREHAGNLLGATLLGTALGLWLMMVALRNAPAGIAATLLSLSPVFMLPLSVFWLRERLKASAVAGTTLGVLGVAVLMWE